MRREVMHENVYPKTVLYSETCCKADRVLHLLRCHWIIDGSILINRSSERVHMMLNDVKIITDVKEYELGDDVQILLDRCWKSFETPKAAVKAWNEEHPDSPLGGSTPLKKVEELMWIGKANIYKRT